MSENSSPGRTAASISPPTAPASESILGKIADQARHAGTHAAMALGFAAVRIGKVAVAGASRADLPNMPEVPHGPR